RSYLLPGRNQDLFSCPDVLTRSPAGKISLPSTILQSYDLGGQRGIRNIWPRYYDDCHAVAYVIDADDGERLSEGWEVFDTVLSAPQMLDYPCCCWPTNKTRHKVCQWRRYDMTPRIGISERLRAHAVTGMETEMRRGESVIASLDVSRHDSCRTRSLKRTSRLVRRDDRDWGRSELVILPLHRRRTPHLVPSLLELSIIVVYLYSSFTYPNSNSIIY
ncbi:hypothetical protein BDZ89DRAFT_596504, partial [Hymenopellis radicata]